MFFGHFFVRWLNERPRALSFSPFPCVCVCVCVCCAICSFWVFDNPARDPEAKETDSACLLVKCCCRLRRLRNVSLLDRCESSNRLPWRSTWLPCCLLSAWRCRVESRCCGMTETNLLSTLILYRLIHAFHKTLRVDCNEKRGNWEEIFKMNKTVS